ncbi:hypothetical protein ANN_26557 [Periplaneta americana]|uniref:DDE-1 domain-containing protein n=1 Tax=Periplaneta americana TaxID=6978 RepID=A0ABQ8RYJ5_PERAM|nr:hypothetical protein ANN_26557 [Periplaneta americana]
MESGFSTLMKQAAGQQGDTCRERKFVTACYSESASGNVLSPAIIFPRIKFRDHILYGALTGSFGLATPSGWMNGDIFPEVIKHFVKHTNSEKDNPSLLIMDNHESYIDCAKRKRVTILTISPQCSNHLQPLVEPLQCNFQKETWESVHGAVLSFNNGVSKKIDVLNLLECHQRSQKNKTRKDQEDKDDPIADSDSAILANIGKPFVLPAELEVKLVNYVTSMQSIGFGLTVHQVRWTAYRAAEAEGINHPFSRKNEKAGFYWWVNFKKRFNLALTTPENLSLNRASMANRDLLNDFYNKTKNLMDDLNLGDKP